MSKTNLWRISLDPGDRYESPDWSARWLRRVSNAYMFIIGSTILWGTLIALVFSLDSGDNLDLLRKIFRRYRDVVAWATGLQCVLLLVLHLGSYVLLLKWMNITTRNTIIVSGEENRFLTLGGFQCASAPIARNLIAWKYFPVLCDYLVPKSTLPAQRAAIYSFFTRRSVFLAGAMLALIFLMGIISRTSSFTDRTNVNLLSALIVIYIFVLFVMNWCWNSMIARINDLQHDRYADYLRTAPDRCPSCGEAPVVADAACPVCGATAANNTRENDQ
ncbi:MAG: hypothetical protein CMJ46_12410 [Planctomyces sp.]|nr:hypothetical protein [Planctomyces sp.]